VEKGGFYMKKYVVANNCFGDNCKCEKFIVYYTEHINNKRPYENLLHFTQNDYINVSTEYCGVSILDNHSKNAICKASDLYLVLPKPFYDECFKKVRQVVSSHLSNHIHDKLIDNIKVHFNNNIFIEEWDLNLVNELATETIDELINM
jgi:hypothetical protein